MPDIIDINDLPQWARSAARIVYDKVEETDTLKGVVTKWHYELNGSAFGHVNRWYWVQMRRLNCLQANANWCRDPRHTDAIVRILQAEKSRLTAEFDAWKKANNHA